VVFVLNIGRLIDIFNIAARTQNPVGVSLLAMAVNQSASMLDVNPLSLASQLLQGMCVVSCCGVYGPTQSGSHH
jgi:hypothetical protein